MDTKEKTLLKVFIPEARVLTEDERAALPRDKRQAVAGKRGLWLEVDCPRGACSFEKNKITLPSAAAESTGGNGLWLDLFCPENQCELRHYTDLP